MEQKTGFRILDRIDALLLLVLAGIFFLNMHFLHDLSRGPMEDAAMLMRYSQHLGGGHGIVWNLGEKPIDGATDFLFMVVIAGLYRAGLSLENAVILVGVVSQLGMIALVYLGIRSLYPNNKWGRWLGLCSGIWLAIGPGLYYTEFFFGTTFFALSICVTWFFAILLTRKDHHPYAIGFAASGLITGLIRPEGVILVCVMLMSVLVYRAMATWQRSIGKVFFNVLKGSKWTFVYFVAIFVLLGAVYFFWRWNYFGYPLPNPFYKKGGGDLYPFSLLGSISNVILFTVPFIPIYVLGLFYCKDKKKIIFPLVPILCFTLMWILLSDEMNHMGRFQYPIVSIVLLSCPPVFEGIFEPIRTKGGPVKNNLAGYLMKGFERHFKKADLKLDPQSGQFKFFNLFVLFIMLSIVILPYGVHSGKNFFVNRYHDGNYDIAILLSDYKDKNYTLVTSEAGILSLYSEWRTIDAWGLNDQTISHGGGIITEGYLNETDPQVIIFHAKFSLLSSVRLDGEWNAMVYVMYKFANENGYILAADFGHITTDSIFIYVAPDFADSGEIIQRVNATQFIWPYDGYLCNNFAYGER